MTVLKLTYISPCTALIFKWISSRLPMSFLLKEENCCM